MAASASAVFLILCAFSTTGTVSAATFAVLNNCSFTVWPAAIPVGGGLQVNPGWTWSLDFPVGTNGRIWAARGAPSSGGHCAPSSGGHCATGDCAGELSCSVPGSPPTTEAEYSIGSDADFYDISLIDGYNLPMVLLQHRQGTPVHGTFQVTFCP